MRPRGHARHCSIVVGHWAGVKVTPSVLLIGVWLGAFNIVRLVDRVLVRLSRLAYRGGIGCRDGRWRRRMRRR